jgi:hypothetical protein
VRFEHINPSRSAVTTQTDIAGSADALVPLSDTVLDTIVRNGGRDLASRIAAASMLETIDALGKVVAGGIPDGPEEFEARFVRTYINRTLDAFPLPGPGEPPLSADELAQQELAIQGVLSEERIIQEALVDSVLYALRGDPGDGPVDQRMFEKRLEFARLSVRQFADRIGLQAPESKKDPSLYDQRTVAEEALPGIPSLRSDKVERSEQVRDAWRRAMVTFVDENFEELADRGILSGFVRATVLDDLVYDRVAEQLETAFRNETRELRDFGSGDMTVAS